MWNFVNQTEGVATCTRLTQHSDQDISEVHLSHLPGSLHVKKHSMYFQKCRWNHKGKSTDNCLLGLLSKPLWLTGKPTFSQIWGYFKLISP